jgi:NAD(P)-dependent dehydrogenase (short-subunit alcohol dehydrogenase family)
VRVPTTLADRRVLVVGASSGIGAAIARRAGATGARVAVGARRADKLAALATQLPGGLALPLDVRDEAAVRAAVDEVVDAFGGLDAVVYATAVSPLAPMEEATAADWRDVLDTNVVGAALVAAATAPHLVAAGGRFVALSSKAVRQPFAHLGLYATSKAALEGLLRCLPVEFPGLLVTKVTVGNTHGTDFAAGWAAAPLDAALRRWTAQGVLGSGHTMHPDEVADAVLGVLRATSHVEEIAVLEHPEPVAGGPRSPE